ncbi:PLP-dependent transferase [Exidia glandulosa HHB12029]|uniref:PLP-dependent transferase n=1 Tax=Exidia glandulosa HHB12029 TaxID=1314781 RepID=A0A166AY30_EXIGL|nr:PLP-dependent transferase [Exidia glandulosa HHB12029]
MRHPMASFAKLLHKFSHNKPSHTELVDRVVKHAHTEHDSEAHKVFRAAPGHNKKGVIPQEIHPEEETVPGVVHPGSTGVIYCSDRAIANGFSYANSHEWANFGQGAPEVGAIPDAPPRVTAIEIDEVTNEYAPTTGLVALRAAVANLYNDTYRKGKTSQYTHENVCIVPGGRAGLSRIAAVVGDVYCAYQVPDYTAYQQVLSAFKRLVPIPTILEQEQHYRLDIEQMKKDVHRQGLSVMVASNPRNPTGQMIAGKDLEQLVQLGREHTTVILDEFYSWYMYPENEEDFGKSLSAAEYVEDVNDDSVVLIDGLTKNWRLPGWRICWVVGPKNLITALSQSGSFLDGGANHPLQAAAIPLLDPQRCLQERIALQKYFKAKRDHVLARLAKMGLPVHIPPQATFYIWLDLSPLPAPLNNGLTFFEELLKEKTIVVPGIFFDVNPSHRRDLFSSPCHHFVRLSFGPPMKDLDMGLDAIERVLHKVQKTDMGGIGEEYVKTEPLSPTSPAGPMTA